MDVIAQEVGAIPTAVICISGDPWKAVEHMMQWNSAKFKIVVTNRLNSSYFKSVLNVMHGLYMSS